MSAPIRLTSHQNPRIKAVARLRKQRERRKQGLLVVEGPRELDRALAAGLGVREFYCSPELLGAAGDSAGADGWLERLPPAAQRFEVPAGLFKKMALLPEPSGLLAVCEQPRWSLHTLPAVRSKSLYLVAVGIEKPGNLGAMARTAEAAGCEALLLGQSVVDPFNPHAIRNSTGAVFTLPTLSVERDQLLTWCRDHGIRLAAATLERARPYTEVDLTGPLALAIGAEDRGLDRAWHEAADATNGPRLHIPMQGRVVDSLNAANAAAVLLFEACRQRGM
jgi:TrmH family RNA methyltransferase